MTTEETKLLQDFVDAFEALQDSQGWNHYMDISETFTAGHWVAGRFLKPYERAKEALRKGGMFPVCVTQRYEDLD